MGNTGTKHQDGAALLAEMDKTMPQKVAICAAHLILNEGSYVLDAGCANGAATAYFALKNPHVNVIGVDYDAEYIAAAQEKYGQIPNLTFIESDLRDLDLGTQKLDAILNLSILHEPYSYTGYRKKTVEDIIAAELKNLKPNGIIINRDFVLPDNPEDMVYLALPNIGEDKGDDYASLSMAEFFLRYAQEAMRYDHGDPDGHVKGFFCEEHTHRFQGTNAKQHNIPEGWRVFSVAHHFAWEFIWRMHYRDRFLNEAEEKYAFWTHTEHKAKPEQLGARVLYSTHYENPWLMENRYLPNARLFDQNMKALPLPPSNFISVLQNIAAGEATTLREHRAAQATPSYLQVTGHKNTLTGQVYDLVERPGGDVLDILPYYFDNGELTIFAKDQYPRPIANTKPRMMTSNLDHKQWSGHMIEPLAAANVEGETGEAVQTVLCERANFSANALKLDHIDSLHYYPAPADLNERVHAVHVEVKDVPKAPDGVLSGQFSGFSTDGLYRHFNAQSLLQAAQAGMLPEARLETNIYALMRNKSITPEPWLEPELTLDKNSNPQITPTPMDTVLAQQKLHKVFEETTERSNWLEVKRSEFHEIALDDGHERVLAKNELEFIVPARNVSTNSVMLLCLTRDHKTGEVLLGVQKISPLQSQFAAIQGHEDYSGLVTLPGYRLPSSVDHIQDVPEWVAKKINVPASAIKKLGEGYFPSLGVMPNRVFPMTVTHISPELAQQCEFVPLREAFARLDELQDLHLINAVFRATHALGLWKDYAQNMPKPSFK